MTGVGTRYNVVDQHISHYAIETLLSGEDQSYYSIMISLWE